MILQCFFVMLVIGLAGPGRTQDELQAVKVMPPIRPVSGQILSLFVRGLSLNPAQTELPSSLKVTITQSGRSLEAPLHRASITMVSGPDGSLERGQSIVFTIPSGLVPGTAVIGFSLNERHSNQLEFEIGDHLPPPGIAVSSVAAVPMRNNPIQTTPSAGTRVPGLTLVLTHGREAGFSITPMIDEREVPDAAVFLTIRQGTLALNVTGRIVHYPGQREGNRYYPPRDEVLVRTPEELSPGEADISLQYRLNGQLSDPVPLKCIVR